MLKNISIVSLFTFISRILGFIRDTIVAQYFGVNAATDAFAVAFKIPNFLRNLFAENAFSQAFVPVLCEYKKHNNHFDIKKLINNFSGFWCASLLLLTLFGIWKSNFIISIFAPGLDAYRYNLSVNMLHITFWYLFFISTTALSGAILNTYGHFAVQAFTPALLNIALIFSAYLLSRYFAISIFSQVYGVFFAGLIQLIFQIPFLIKYNLFFIPKFSLSPGVKKIFTLVLPALFGASMAQISILINTIFASYLKVGSITWLYYSERIAYFPLGVFGVAIATVALPKMSSYFVTKDQSKLQKSIDWSLKSNLIIGIPATIAMIILSKQIIVTLFNYGRFSFIDVLMTQKSLIAYALGLQAFMCMKIITSVFYAMQDPKTVVKIGTYIIFVNIILNAILSYLYEHAGLALAASIGSWLNLICLIYILHKKKIFSFDSTWKRFTFYLIIINGIVGVFLLLCPRNMDIWLAWNWKLRIFRLASYGLVAIIAYLSLIKKFKLLNKFT